MQITEQQVARNHPAGKEHGKGKKKDDNFSPRNVGTGKAVGCCHGHRDVNKGGSYRIKDGIPEPQPDSRGVKNRAVARKSRFNRPKQHFAGLNRRSGRKRSGDNKNTRVKNNQEKQSKNDKYKSVEYFIPCSNFSKP
jgi:hypothetical protein